MSMETVHRTSAFIRTMEPQDEVMFLWHWGEPLVLRPEWYAKAQSILTAELAQAQVRFHFQTNATLLSDEWVSFFQSQPDTRVSVSLDGPRHLHDRHRHTRRGGPSHARATEGTLRLKAANVPFSCIAVIAADTLDYPEEFYDYFVDLGPTLLALSPEEQEGAHRGSTLFEPSQELRYRRFWRRLLDLWCRDRPFLIREILSFDQELGRLNGQDISPHENHQTTAGGVLSVGWQGDVHTFSPEFLGSEIPGVGTHLANVHTHNWADVLSSTPLLGLQRDISEGVERCRRSCDYFDLCKGGAPSNKWFEHKSLMATETRYCRLSVKLPYDEYLAALSAAQVWA